jgi:competence protein ComEC
MSSVTTLAMQSFRLFFANNPCLFYALFAVLGASAYLERNGFWPILLGSLLSCLSISLSRCILGWIVLLAAFLLTAQSIVFTKIPEKGVEGFAWISIENLSYQTQFHQRGWSYKGRILSFWEEGGDKTTIQGIPFTSSFPDSMQERPSANFSYLVKCRLAPSHGKRVILKSAARTPWEPVKKRFSFVEERFWIKQKVKGWIEKHYRSSAAATFLTGLLIGEFDDNQIKQDFGRLGLLHLLAISGFHFGILASFLNKVLRALLSPRWLSFTLIGMLSSYFFLLGWGPSVVRAWMTIVLFYSAYLGRRRSLPVNSLGAAVLFAVFIDPLLIENLGFQFSAVTTAAILILNPLCLNGIESFWEKRKFSDVIRWPFTHQTAYLILSFLKDNLALCLSTTLAAVPISLFYFQYFPLLSLVYNAFFPFMVSISMTFLLAGLLLMPFWIGRGIHQLNDAFTSFLLNMTYDTPTSWDWKIQAAEVPCSLVIAFFIFIFLLSIYFQKSEKELKW